MENKKDVMMEEVPELTRVSSKGQVVIPLHLRKKLHVKEGSVFAVSSFNGDMLLLKKLRNPITTRDLMLAKEAEEAWKEIDRGEFRETSVNRFRKELESW